MAANLQKGGSISFCKRLNQIWASNFRDPVPGSSPAVSGFRNWVHSSTYDKNPEDHGLNTIVPDDALESQSDGKYWALHPETGVFAPPTQGGNAVTSRHGGDHQRGTQPTSNGGSVLDQQAWFRPLEGVDKPPQTD